MQIKSRESQFEQVTERNQDYGVVLPLKSICTIEKERCESNFYYVIKLQMIFDTLLT